MGTYDLGILKTTRTTTAVLMSSAAKRVGLTFVSDQGKSQFVIYELTDVYAFYTFSRKKFAWHINIVFGT